MLFKHFFIRVLMDFSSFSFHPAIAANIEAAKYAEATPIQQKAIPAMLSGRDVLGLAQTGTGKTAAFALPILQMLLEGSRCRARALIVSPTRELAEQTNKVFREFSKGTELRSMSVFGGVSTKSQIKELKNSMPEILVACPGRLLDLLGQGAIRLDAIEILVLDEADQMFDMGFLPSIKKIVAALPREHKTHLFSATLPKEIRSLARQFQRDPVRVEIGESRPAETVRHFMRSLDQGDKYETLRSVLGRIGTEGQTLIFTRTKHRAKKLALQLANAGFEATSLQGNLSQGQREKAMSSFRSGRATIMVATDIASRGIDVTQISHVINFDMPDTPEAYTHRIGRTGRMMRQGIALTFVTPDDRKLLRSIESLLGSAIPAMA
jgi:ATP-dependent RNA helicase RhlE